MTLRNTLLLVAIALWIPFAITVVRESAERRWENTAVEANARIVHAVPTWAGDLLFYDGIRKPDGTYLMIKKFGVRLPLRPPSWERHPEMHLFRPISPVYKNDVDVVREN